MKAFGGDRLAANYKTAAAIQGAYRDDPEYGVVVRLPGVGVTVYLSSITSEMQQMPAFERTATLTPSPGFMSGPRIANPDEADSRWSLLRARPSGHTRAHGCGPRSNRAMSDLCPNCEVNSIQGESNIVALS